jgi:hypothetical protein
MKTRELEKVTVDMTPFNDDGWQPSNQASLL